MRLPLWLFGGFAVVELAGVALSWHPLQWIAKPLLAPLLLWYLLRKAGMSLIGWGLVFATAGDVALLVPGTAPFLLGMVCFLGTQVCFLLAFLRRAPLSRPFAAGYALLWAALNALLWPSLGTLRIPILVYSLALSTMAATAVAVSRTVAAGAALFLLSDLLIGLGAADLDFPGRDLTVMTTYIAALLLITTGSTQRTDTTRALQDAGGEEHTPPQQGTDGTPGVRAAAPAPSRPGAAPGPIGTGRPHGTGRRPRV